MSTDEKLIVSVSGIRGIVGKSLDAATVVAFASALATHVQGRPIVLCRDGRPSGQTFRHAALAGLLSAGCDVHDIGVAPTPTCGLAIRRLGAAGGIQITASHNPSEWNGLKLFGADGAVLSATEGAQLRDLFAARRFRSAAWDAIGRATENAKAVDWHRDRVLELVDVAAIQARKPRVVLDANGGAGGPLGMRLLDALQCQPTVLAGEADGLFRHEPEPIADNLREMCPLVPQYGADIGFVLDPDADRLAVIDENGRYIGEELTLALAVQFRLSQERGPVVINMSTSRVTEDLAQWAGCPCHRSAVGEANVVERMRSLGAVIGGEGNGGVIDPRVGYVRDPFIGMALILNWMAVSGKKLSELVAALPPYAIVKEKHTFDPAGLAALFDRLEKHWASARPNRQDGLRLDWPDRWIHVRSSNTEPIVRVIAEAPTIDQAQALSRELAGCL